MKVNPLYDISWKKSLASYRCRRGEGLPGSHIKGLYDYFTKGEIPDGILGSLLKGSLLEVINSSEMGVTYARARTTWEFLKMNAPLNSWGTEDKVMKWSQATATGKLGELQRGFVDSANSLYRDLLKKNDIDIG